MKKDILQDGFKFHKAGMHSAHSANSYAFDGLVIASLIIAGFLLAKTTIWGHVSPFSVSFIASVSGLNCAFVLVGALVGFVTGNFYDGIPTLAAMLAICIFRIFMGTRSCDKSYKLHILSCILTSITVTITSLAVASKPSDCIVAGVFGIISGVATYALKDVSDKLKKGNVNKNNLSLLNIAMFGIVYLFVIASFTSLQYGIINIGVLVAAFCILVFSKMASPTFSVILAAIASFGMVLCNVGYLSSGFMLVFGSIGAIVGIRFGKMITSTSFVLSAALAFAITGATDYKTLIGMLISSIVFLFVPVKELWGNIMENNTTAVHNMDLSKVFSEKLKIVGNTISDVQYTIIKTAEVLEKDANCNDISWVYEKACDKVCKGCCYNMKCWGDDYNDTASIMNDIVKKQKSGILISANDFPPTFRLQCSHRDKLVIAISEKYREFVCNQTAVRKVAEMRSLLIAELSNTEKLLIGMSNELLEDKKHDSAGSTLIEEILKEQGITEPVVDVTTENNVVLVVAFGKGKLQCTGEFLCIAAASALHREFDLPQFNSKGNDFFMTMFSRANYAVELAYSQISKDKSKSCGDFVESFIDGKGNFYAVLSDGMGSGGRARIDSAFASGLLVKLLGANMDVMTAVSFLNTSLLVKSSDESFATLDICKTNLYTGNLTIYKAGGAASYVKIGKNIKKASGEGLPIGICCEATIKEQNFTLSNNDIIIMMSDGVLVNELWLENELLKEQDLKTFTDELANNARFNTEKDKLDDITVMAMRIKK